MQYARPASVRSSDVFLSALQLSVASEQWLSRTSHRHISSRAGKLYEPAFATATRWNGAYTEVYVIFFASARHK